MHFCEKEKFKFYFKCKRTMINYMIENLKHHFQYKKIEITEFMKPDWNDRKKIS